MIVQTVERVLAVDGNRSLTVHGQVREGAVNLSSIVLYERGFFSEPFRVQPDRRTRSALGYFLLTGDLDGTLRKAGYDA